MYCYKMLGRDNITVTGSCKAFPKRYMIKPSTNQPTNQSTINPLTPQPQKQTRVLPTILSIPSTRQVSNIGVIRQGISDLPSSIDTTNLNHARTSLANSLADDIRTLGFTLRPDDVGLTLLLGSLDNETGPFRILLGDLLLLDGFCELTAECHVGDGYILEGDVKLRSSLH